MECVTSPAAAAPVRNAFREQQWREAHERYLLCARTVFERLGYQDATVADIVEAASGSRATFYAHFRDKADIAACLFERTLPAAAAIFRRVTEFAEPSRALVRAWLDEHALRFWSRHRVEAEAINHAMSADPSVAARHQEWIVATAGQLGPCLARWTGADARVGQTRASLLVLQLEQLCHHWLVRGVEHDRELMLDILADLWSRELLLLREGPPR